MYSRKGVVRGLHFTSASSWAVSVRCLGRWSVSDYTQTRSEVQQCCTVWQVSSSFENLSERGRVKTGSWVAAV